MLHFKHFLTIILIASSTLSFAGRPPAAIETTDNTTAVTTGPTELSTPILDVNLVAPVADIGDGGTTGKVKRSRLGRRIKSTRADRRAERKRTRKPEPSSPLQDLPLWALAIIALFIPFLAVGLYEGMITERFWISLLLTLLFFVPGVVYAMLVIFDVI